MHLDTGVYFRTREISSLTLLDYSHLLVPTKLLCSWGLDFPSPQVGHGWPGKAVQTWDSSCCATVGSADHPQVSVVWVPGIHLYTCPCSLGSSATSRIFPEASIFFPDLLPCFSQDSIFVSWSLIFGMEPQVPGFLHLSSLYTGT